MTEIKLSLGPIRRRLDELVERRTGLGLCAAEQEEYDALLAAEIQALAQRWS